MDTSPGGAWRHIPNRCVVILPPDVVAADFKQAIALRDERVEFILVGIAIETVICGPGVAALRRIGDRGGRNDATSTGYRWLKQTQPACDSCCADSGGDGAEKPAARSAAVPKLRGGEIFRIHPRSSWMV